MTRTQICNCGHVNEMHTGAACRACSCNQFAVASDAQAGILAGIERKKAAIAAANGQRANYRGQVVNR